MDTITNEQMLDALRVLGNVCADAKGICDQCRLYSNRQKGCLLQGDHALLLHKAEGLKFDLINMKEEETYDKQGYNY